MATATAVGSSLHCLYFQGSVPRRQPAPDDLFMPELKPFNLATSEPNVASHPGALSLISANSISANAKSSAGSMTTTDSHATSREATQDMRSEEDVRHPFRLLPSVLFEHLSDPHMLNSMVKTGKSSLPDASWSLQEEQQQHLQEQQQQQHIGMNESSSGWQNDENQVQSTLQTMQQRPAWLPPGTGMLHA